MKREIARLHTLFTAMGGKQNGGKLAADIIHNAL